MLQVQFIKDNQKKVLDGLAKRNFANANTIIDAVLKADEKRRKTQVLLDNTLAELNTLSKEIGLLFKSGQTQKATIVKEKTSLLKEQSKALTDQLNALSKELTDLLYQLPNIPHEGCLVVGTINQLALLKGHLIDQLKLLIVL